METFVADGLRPHYLDGTLQSQTRFDAETMMYRNRERACESLAGYEYFRGDAIKAGAT
jgi:hypothetical protein